MKKTSLLGLCLFALILSGCQWFGSQPTEITSFEECVEAGNPVMESYPRQCAANGQTFTEEIDELPPVDEVPPRDELPPSDLPGTDQPDEDQPQAGIKEFIACESQPEICTFEFDPVCGMVDNDAKQFSNGCTACSQGANGYYEGPCSKNTFIVCNETVTGFSPEQYAEDIGGICVDVCPGNYDAFTTQTGIQVCIRHYGEEEISEWETCDRSTDSCECVKASETTTGEPIDEPEYRCVPDKYAERMLFRSGVDKLDENGEQSVAIA